MARLSELNMVTGWRMGGGFTDDPGRSKLRLPVRSSAGDAVPVEPATWGGIKARFN
jgi:hypothetical protein